MIPCALLASACIEGPGLEPVVAIDRLDLTLSATQPARVRYRAAVDMEGRRSLWDAGGGERVGLLWLRARVMTFDARADVPLTIELSSDSTDVNPYYAPTSHRVGSAVLRPAENGADVEIPLDRCDGGGGIATMMGTCAIEAELTISAPEATSPIMVPVELTLESEALFVDEEDNGWSGSLTLERIE